MSNIALYVYVCLSLNHVWLFVTLWAVAHQVPLSMEFSRQEYWSELPFPSPGDLLDWTWVSCLAGRFFTIWATRKAFVCIYHIVMTNLDSILKSRHYFANKGLSSQSCGFSSSYVWMWEWTIKKAECQRIDAFELWCWRGFLRVPWTARRSNQSILKELNPEYSLEGLMQKLKLQYFGLLMRKTFHWNRPWCWERWRAGGEGNNRRRDGWMASPTQWTWVWVNSGNWWWTGTPGVLQSMGLQRVGHDWATELADWLTTLFIHPSVNEYLGCFHLLAIVNNATINVSVPAFNSLGYMPRSGITG